MNLHTGLLRSSANVLSATNFSKTFLCCGTFSNSSTNHKILNYSTATNSQEVITPPGKEIIDPLQHPDFFGVKKLVTLEDLFNARVHYGHKKGSRNE